MTLETDASDGLSEGGSPKADSSLSEHFGLTVRQVKEFDPQTLDVTRACKVLGLPLKRFDQLAAQPEERARWVEMLARQKKELIETFPEASKELKEMLEAIRKFALRKCLKPDGPALIAGQASRKDDLKRPKGRRLGFIAVGLAVVVLVGAGMYWVMRPAAGQADVPPQASGLNSSGANVPGAPEKPAPLPVPEPPPVAVRVVHSCSLDQFKPFVRHWKPKTGYLALQKALPNGIWAGCYNAMSQGEFCLEKMDGHMVFGLASRGAPATAQLAVEIETLTGGLQADRRYTLQFEYLTRSNPGGFVGWLDEKFNLLARKDLADTEGQWRFASLAVDRKKTQIRPIIDSQAVTSDGMLYVRKLSITEEIK
ncbi:MAG: hypothetical protein U0840_27520 [Gemmataceae bacterium]